ncbi:hypothetical protein [Burkholderia sp. S-53]|uniref:hypothetical protein n=1 Tax=Burkholderia sp. S-53 TaxID=2906514 RepID=UPI0021CFEE1C|nr:hypothetical protein [Burkholderia sp. S-53]UXU91050.1 hypothetical protein LXM88_23000 [Burkholderia sp. S-53]
MDIDELLTVEERKEDGTGSLKTGRLRGVRCAGAYLRAINGTLRAAVPVRLRIGRARFAAQTARERDWKPCHATPGRGTGRRAGGGTPRDADAVANLDRPKSCVKRRPPHPIHSSERTRRITVDSTVPADRPSRVSADSDTCAQCLTATSARAAWQRVFATRY